MATARFWLAASVGVFLYSRWIYPRVVGNPRVRFNARFGTYVGTFAIAVAIVRVVQAGTQSRT